jgi:hypothetical protein
MSGGSGGDHAEIIGFVRIEGHFVLAFGQFNPLCWGGRMLQPDRPGGTPIENRQCAAMLEAFANLKPMDAVIVGVYQQFGDQVGENAAIVREVGSRH